MAVLDLGRVRGDDGFSPVITVEENGQLAYRLRVKTKDNEFVTPNLRGAVFRSAFVEVFGQDSVYIPFSDLGLDPAKNYRFYASSGVEYPLLRSIIISRVNDAVCVTIYTDTQPYTVPQKGSPFPSGIRKFGEPDLKFGGFKFGLKFDRRSFPVNILCFEISAA